MPVATDFEGTELLKVTRNRGLSDGEAEAGKTLCNLFLTREVFRSDEFRDRSLATFLQFAHAVLMHELA